MKIKLALTAAIVSSAVMLMAEPVVMTGSAVVPSADGAMILTPGKRVSTAKMYPVDPAKSYILSGEFRTQKKAGVNPPAVLLGVIPFDAHKRQIARSMVDAVEGTETELAAAVKKGAKSLIVKDASKWKKNLNVYAVAFDVKPDYADLPNRNMALLITKFEKVKEGWKIDFSIPLGKDYPAGTKVRQHQEGGYCWCGLADRVISGNEWTADGSTITGEYTFGGGYQKFWRGTRFVKIVISCSKGTPLEFRNLEFTEEK